MGDQGWALLHDPERGDDLWHDVSATQNRGPAKVVRFFVACSRQSIDDYGVSTEPRRPAWSGAQLCEECVTLGGA